MAMPCTKDGEKDKESQLHFSSNRMHIIDW